MEQVRWLKSHLDPKRKSKKNKGIVIGLADVPKLEGAQKLEAALRPNRHAIAPTPTPPAASMQQQRGIGVPTQEDVPQRTATSQATAPSTDVVVVESTLNHAGVLPVQASTHSNPILKALEEDLPMRYKDGVYISRNLEVPDSEQKRAFFDPDPQAGIRARLMPIIRFRGDDIRGNHADYVMGGKSAKEVDWKPMVVIFCANNQQKRVIERSTLLPAIMKGYEYIIETEETQLASGGLHSSLMDVQLDGRAVSGGFDAEFPTLCGMICRVGSNSNTSEPEVPFKLGGLVMVDDRWYGFTAAHNISKVDPTEGSLPINLEHNFDTKLPSSDFKGSSKMVEIGQVEVLEYSSPLDHDPRELSWDWALIRMDASHVRPNLVFSPYPQYDKSIQAQSFPIDGVVSLKDMAFGEVWVIDSPNSSILAILIQRTVLLAFGENNFEAFPIKLAQPLEDGSSGSWVIREGKVCGYIFSRVVGKPWAYMLPIEPVLSRISKFYSSLKESNPIVVTISHKGKGESSATQKAADLSIEQDSDAVSHARNEASSGLEVGPTLGELPSSISFASLKRIHQDSGATGSINEDPVQPELPTEGSSVHSRSLPVDATQTTSNITSRIINSRPDHSSRFSKTNAEVFASSRAPKHDTKGKMPVHLSQDAILESATPMKEPMATSMVHVSDLFILLTKLIKPPPPMFKARRRWLQHLSGQIMCEGVIFQDFLFRFSNRYAPSHARIQGGMDFAALWLEPRFQKNLDAGLSPEKLDAIARTCFELESDLEILRDAVEKRRASPTVMLVMNDALFRQRQSIETQVARLAEYNNRLNRLMAYNLRPHRVRNTKAAPVLGRSKSY